MHVLSTEYPNSNYRIDGLLNWLFGLCMVGTPGVIYDWIDYLAHARWYRSVNDKLERQLSMFETVFGRFVVPEAPVDNSSRG